MPTGVKQLTFDLIMCRNLAFTYFDAGLQDETARRLASVLRPGGALVLGAHEQLPAGLAGLQAWDGRDEIYRWPPIAAEG